MSTKVKTFQFLVEGGKASAGPPIGPSLGPLGINVLEVVKRINELTKDFAGMRVPVKVTVDTEKKKFDVEVGMPTTAALLIKEVKAEKGSGQAGRAFVGSIPFETIVKVAALKKEDVGAKTLKAAVKCVIGTCQSMGIKIDGKTPKELLKAVDDGSYDELIKKLEKGGVTT
ncbi:MAG: 50S ribosomal protein L11 [Thermofilaceae archaeon]|nr:50S ribosomal protein L11 [Thermofilaceae archaeon]